MDAPVMRVALLLSSWRDLRLRGSDAALLCIAIVAFGARFFNLEHSPPAMWVDEWIGASHIGCVLQAGQSAHGERWPLFVVAGGGGYVTPIFLYFGVLWSKLFGMSPAALRSIAAFFVAGTIVGTVLLAKRLGGPRTAFWVAVLACLSPWGFQFSRIAWDPPLAPAFVVWSCYCWLLEPAWISGVLSGAMAAGAVYSYPPQRIQMPLLFACLFFLTPRRGQVRRLLAFALTGTLLTIPLAKQMLSPEFLGRGNALAIFAREYVEQNRGHSSSLRFLLQSLLDNLALHLRPSFLFISGDPNLRHSTQSFGELGYLEIFALVLGITRLASLLANCDEPVRPTRSELRTSVLAIAGVLSGLIPAAMTWEGLPHALRALGSWPFFSLLGASFLVHAERRWVKLGRVACVISTGYAAWFGWCYFAEYPRLARDAFTATTFEAARRWPQLSSGERAMLAREHPDLVRYALMANGTHRCLDSERERQRALAPHAAPGP